MTTLDHPERGSRLFPEGPRLAHADLHNHTLVSDGAGDPSAAFASIRAAGLDVAALTDHIWHREGGVDDRSWAELLAIADHFDEPGTFVAMRGFEWTTDAHGHMNVWFSERWLRPGAGPDSLAALHRWLRESPDGRLASFNHPGRERGRFDEFAAAGDPVLGEVVVGFEIFNRYDDYLFEGVDRGARSPLIACLDAGWRVGLLGVTDEHGGEWGHAEDKGRTGLWLERLDREGVRGALRARRSFATRQRGMRVDASAGPVEGPGPARMGGTLAHRRGDLGFVLDLDGPELAGQPVVVQVLQTGSSVPRVVASVEAIVPGPSAPLLRLTTPVDVEDGRWVVLRICDPTLPADPRAVGDYRDAGHALAYASPFYLDPDTVS